jgi:hypothetical protein
MSRAPIHEPTLQDVLESSIASIIGQLHTCFPASIETYDESKSMASVQPLISRKYDGGDIVDFPVIPNVPVVWMRTTLGSVSFPLSRGDGVLVLCAERSLDEWLSKGLKVAPEDKRRYALIDAIVIPGLFAFNSTTKISGNTSFQIHFKNQTIQITDSGEIEIGSAPLQKAMTEAYKTALGIYLTAVQTFMSSCVASTTDPVLAAAATAFLATFPGGFLPPANGLTSKVTLE